jgi:tRNA(Arg) A34 adenosine deaminase TadA
LNDPTAHAEILVLRKAGKALGNYRLNETTLYVTAEPCPMCAAAMVHGGFLKVFGVREPNLVLLIPFLSQATNSTIGCRLRRDSRVECTGKS